MKPYYKTDNTTLYKGDSLELLKKIDDDSIDLIFSDPPYFLSGDGITCQNGKMVSVNKGDWDKIDTYKVMNQTELKNLSEILSKDLKATLNLS